MKRIVGFTVLAASIGAVFGPVSPAAAGACTTWQYYVESSGAEVGGVWVYDRYFFSSPIVGHLRVGRIINSRSVGEDWVRVDNWYLSHGGAPNDEYATDYVLKDYLDFVDCW